MLPAPRGGLLVACDQSVAYVAGGGDAAPLVRGGMPAGSITAVARIDADGSRWLLGDHTGGLRVLVVRGDAAAVSDVSAELLGRTSCASCIAYLDSGVLYLGSAIGDSQLLRLRAPRVGLARFSAVQRGLEQLRPGLDCSKLSSKLL